MAEKFTLPKESVEIRYIKKQTGLITDENHVSYGGLMDGSTITLPANTLRNGNYVNVLTAEEKDYLEEMLSMSKNGLSVYAKKEENYWKNIKVTLTKEGLILDLNDPEEYIKYKQLLSYKELIAPNLRSIEGDRNKKSYKFVIVRKDDEAKSTLKKVDIMKEAYKQFGKMEDSRETMINYLAVSGMKVSPDTSMDALRVKIGEAIATSAKDFVNTLSDDSYNTRVLLHRSMTKGNIYKKGNFYYTKSGDSIGEPNQPATLENVIAFLDSDLNQEYRILLETKLEE